MGRSKLPKETVDQLLKCQRWGVCDDGTADICAVDLKTVHRFQQVATQRAETHHRQVVRAVEVAGVQLDEAHSKLYPRQAKWLHTALAMGSWFLLRVDFGLRTQHIAARLLAQVVARVRALPLCLTDGWKAYPTALLRVVRVVYRSRRRGTDGQTTGAPAKPSTPGSAQRPYTEEVLSYGDHGRERRRGSPYAESCLRCLLLFSRTTLKCVGRIPLA